MIDCCITDSIFRRDLDAADTTSTTSKHTQTKSVVHALLKEGRNASCWKIVPNQAIFFQRSMKTPVKNAETYPMGSQVEGETGNRPVNTQGSLHGLNRTECRVLGAIVDRVPAEECSTVIENSQLALAVGLSIRTVKDANKRLQEFGIFQRMPLEPKPFSKMQTSFASPAMLDRLREELRPLMGCGFQSVKPMRKAHDGGSKRKKRTLVDKTVATERFPFRSLRSPLRFLGMTAPLETAIADGARYWDWLASAITASKTVLTLRLESQKRRVSDGKRGGPIGFRHREVVLAPGVAQQIEPYAHGCYQAEFEGTFGISEECHPVLLVDDVSEVALQRLAFPCASLETSPGSYQVTLVSPKALTKQERLFAQRALIEMIDGDDGANSASQLRRFPGSINNKPELAHAFVTRVHQVSTSFTMDSKAVDALIAAGDSMLSRSGFLNKEKGNVLPSEISTNLPKKSGSRDESQSAKDFAFAIAQLKVGTPDQVILDALMGSAARRQKYGAPAGSLGHHAYAARTLRNARRRITDKG